MIFTNILLREFLAAASCTPSCRRMFESLGDVALSRLFKSTRGANRLGVDEFVAILGRVTSSWNAQVSSIPARCRAGFESWDVVTLPRQFENTGGANRLGLEELCSRCTVTRSWNAQGSSLSGRCRAGGGRWSYGKRLITYYPHFFSTVF